MISASTPRLFDLCATSIVYRLWTRQDVYENWHECNHWELLEIKVTADVESLPIPELVNSCLLSLVKPVSRHFFAFLNVWLAKMATDEKWLTRGILSDCLSLYAVGIINQRKTAKNLLRNKNLDNVIAFRLACINFLEEEILLIWPYVMQYFLNKIVVDHQKYSSECFQNALNGYRGVSHEPHEVFFWIGFCLSKENETHFNEVPHYLSPFHKWRAFAFSLACCSGDITFFDYIVKCCGKDVFFRHEDVLEKWFGSNIYLINFFYHFSSLNPDIRLHLFQKHPKEVVSYFLQWPLSSLFHNPQEICDLLNQHNLLDWFLVTILEILHGVRYLAHQGGGGTATIKVRTARNEYRLSKVQVSNVYYSDHLEQIWTAIWEICPDATKSRIMDSFAFTDNLNDFLERVSPVLNFDSPSLKKGLRRLFQTNGEVFLMFLEEKKLSDALEKVISKHMPERNLDFQILQSFPYRNIPHFTVRTGRELLVGMPENIRLLSSLRENFQMVAGLRLPDDARFSCITFIRPLKKFDLLKNTISFSPEFIRYIQEFLFTNNMNNSVLY